MTRVFAYDIMVIVDIILWNVDRKNTIAVADDLFEYDGV